VSVAEPAADGDGTLLGAEVGATDGALVGAGVAAPLLHAVATIATTPTRDANRYFVFTCADLLQE